MRIIWFILTLAVIGGVIGLIFSRRDDPSGGFWGGARSGAKLGCGCVTVIILLLVAVVVFVLA